MNKDIKKLELKRLFKEFGFLKADDEYKSEIQLTYGREFEKNVKKTFQENTGLDIIFNSNTSNSDNQELEKHKFIGDKIYDPTNENTQTGIELLSTYTESIKTENKINEEVKKLYRKIATKTHPDKVSNKYLNNLYMKAQGAYNKNDVFTLYLICNDLDIEYNFIPDKLTDFKLIINELKNKNSFIEKTYLWVWVHEENEEIRKNIIQNFISNTL